MDKGLMFLIKLAWDSRVRLPLIIAIGLIACDIRTQFEINIHVRNIRRMRPIRSTNSSSSESEIGSDDSWITDEEMQLSNEELVQPAH